VQVDKKKDSLLALFSSAKHDTSKINALLELGIYCYKKRELDNALKYHSNAFSLAEKISLDKKKAITSFWLAKTFNTKAQYKEAGEYALLAAELSQKTGDDTIRAMSFLIKGNTLYNTDKYAEALNYVFKALQSNEKPKSKRINGACMQALAIYYNSLDRPEEAMDYSRKSVVAWKETGDRKYIMQVYCESASILSEKGNYNTTLTYLDSAFQLLKEFKNEKPVWQPALIYSLYGQAYEVKGDEETKTNKEKADSTYRLALKYYLSMMNEWEEVRRKKTMGIADAAIADGYILIANICYKLRQINKARDYAEKGIAECIKYESLYKAAIGHLILSKIDSAGQDYKNAFFHFRHYQDFIDSTKGSAAQKKIDGYRNEYLIDKKEKELQLLTTENQLKTTLAAQQNQKRKFAYALSGLILLGSGYGVYRYRKFNKQKSEQKRLKERLAISQDLHDHVGSTLSSISVFSKVAQVEGEKGNTGQMSELLDRIRHTSVKMMTEMNDIVWAINPQNDTMEKIIQRMESFARPLLTARNMQFHFNYDKEVLLLNLEMEQRKNFYLIFKEAVNNAIKYSGGSLLEANIIYQQGLLELNVKDNGVGFNMEQEMNETKSLSGNGLKNMKARAKEMNANLLIDSGQEKGTLIKLVCPFV
jgi:signal transduction histidine kinase